MRFDLCECCICFPGKVQSVYLMYGSSQLGSGMPPNRQSRYVCLRVDSLDLNRPMMLSKADTLATSDHRLILAGMLWAAFKDGGVQC